MDLLIWIVVGLVVGRIVQVRLMDDWHDFTPRNLGAGVAGAVIAGWLLRMTGLAGATGISLWVPIVAVVGALAMLWGGRVFTSTPTLR